MPTVSDDQSFITFTEEEAAVFSGAGGPDLAYLDELINNYALAQGGEILAVWECVQGPRMGKQVKWSPNRIAEHLGIPQSTMNQILNDTMAAVWPAWTASPQYARFEQTHHCGGSGCSFY